MRQEGHRTRRAIAVALLLAGCSGDVGEAGRGGPRGDRPEPVTVVEVADVTRGSVSDVLVSHAVVESERSADLHPQATGIAVSVVRDEGDRVRRGEVLAVLDNVSLEAGAERARADLARLEREVASLQALHAEGAVSDRELAEARHQLDNARSAAREATRTSGQTRITAPFEGVVAARDLRLGELATSGQRAFQVVDPDALRVVSELPERDVGRVAVGQTARIASAYDPELATTGVVARVAPVVDPTSGTFRVTLSLDEAQQALRPGQFVSVALEVDRHEDVVVVPRAAVTWQDGRPIGWRMIPEPPEPEPEEPEEPETAEAPGFLARWFGGDTPAPERPERPEVAGDRFVAERVELTLGLVDERLAEVVDGVSEGDRVITVGQATLRDGALVRTPEMQAEARRRAEEAADAGDEG